MGGGDAWPRGQKPPPQRPPPAGSPPSSLPCIQGVPHTASSHVGVPGALIPGLGVVSQVWGLYPGLGGGPVAGQGPLQPRSVPAVMLTGGIVAVAGQFKGWYFAAYAMYPCGEGTRGPICRENPAPIGVGGMDGGETSSSSRAGPKSLFFCPKQPFFFG